MNNKNLKIFLVLLACFELMITQAQMLYLMKKNNLQTSIHIKDIRKLTFNSGNLMVNEIGNSNISYTLSDIRYLNFTDLTSELIPNVNKQKNNFVICPNPAQDFLNIDYKSTVQAKVLIIIVSLNGGIVLFQPLSLKNNSNNAKINISGLKRGIYVFQLIDDTGLTVFKFMKN
jgi:hypothetical protein